MTAVAKALAFLIEEQDESGAFPSECTGLSIHPIQNRRLDCNSFTTSLVLETFANSSTDPNVSDMTQRARGFLATCAAPAPVGSYGFWSTGNPHFRADPDLDDTALVRTALRLPLDREIDPIFSPYRTVRGEGLGIESTWVSRYPGVFRTWMMETRTLVDLAVNANVVRHLRSNHAQSSGLKEAEKMISDLLNGGQDLAAYSPYYRSHTLVLWRCAMAVQAGASFREPLRRRLAAINAHSLCEPAAALHVAAAHLAIGNSVPACIQTMIPRQLPDGGWPPMRICSNSTGRINWHSRAVSTSLAVSVILSSRGVFCA